MVSIVTCTNRNDQMANVFHNYSQQDWAKKELIVVLNGNDMELRKWQRKAKHHSNVIVYQLPAEDSLGKCLNFASTKAKYDIIAKFDDDDYYSPYYIPQAMYEFKHNQADVVGKPRFFTYFSESKNLCVRRSNMSIGGGTIMFRKEVLHKVEFPEKNKGEDTVFLQRVKENQFNIINTNRYNYVSVRNPVKFHTWKANNKRLMKRCSDKQETDNYISIVTQPPSKMN